MIYVITRYEIHDPELHSVAGVATTKEKLVKLLREMLDPLLEKGFHLEEDNDAVFLDCVKPSCGLLPDGFSIIVHGYEDGQVTPGEETIRGVRQLIGR